MRRRPRQAAKASTQAQVHRFSVPRRPPHPHRDISVSPISLVHNTYASTASKSYSQAGKLEWYRRQVGLDVQSSPHRQLTNQNEPSLQCASRLFKTACHVDCHRHGPSRTKQFPEPEPHQLGPKPAREHLCALGYRKRCLGRSRVGIVNSWRASTNNSVQPADTRWSGEGRGVSASSHSDMTRCVLSVVYASPANASNASAVKKP